MDHGRAIGMLIQDSKCDQSGLAYFTPEAILLLDESAKVRNPQVRTIAGGAPHNG